MLDPYALIRPIVFKMDPEDAHGMTIRALKSGLIPPIGKPVRDKSLEVDLWGLKFPNPIGLSAGFDKNAEVIAPMLRLGFGFTEVGTVTPKPQAGNPRPRIFRDPPARAVINRMGFPNGGADAFMENLQKFLRGRSAIKGVVGINIGMNKDQTDPKLDYAALMKAFGPVADYITINISSPSTPGIRNLQRHEALRDLLQAVMDARAAIKGRHPPLLVKLVPDLDEDIQKEMATTLMDYKVDGLIMTNTRFERIGTLDPNFSAQQGGLSGAPIRELATQTIRNFYRLTGGAIPIIGVGGVSTGADAYEKIKAGASLIQLYTALVYRGPGVAQSIIHELLALMKKDGLRHISEAIGADHKK